MKIFLIDGNSYVYRAFYAIKGLTDTSGRPTNAVFGFTNMLLKIMREKKPDAIVVAFDAAKRTKRHDIYPDYKANRAATPEELIAQMPIVKDMVRAMNITHLEAEGYEADDILATLASRAEAHGAEVFVVSSDKDMLQMVTDRVKVYDPMKDKLIGPPEVEARFGVPPARVTEYMALVGDASDNVPGVKGVGDKTAQQLLRDFSSLDDLIDNAQNITKPRLKKLIAEGVDNIRLSKRLVELDTSVPVDADINEMTTVEPDWKKLKEAFIQLGFSSLLKLIPQEAAPVEKMDCQCVLEAAKLDHILSAATEIIGIDTESTGTDPMRHQLVGFSLMTPGGRAAYIPLRHAYLEAPRQIPAPEALEALGRTMADDTIAKCGHNLKYDILLLKGEGVETRGVLYDTMVASYLLNPERQSHSLESVALDHLGRTKSPFKEVAGKGTFAEVHVEEATEYAAMDAALPLDLKDKLFPRLKSQGMEDIYFKMEMPLITILAGMEEAGVNLDTQKLAEVNAELEREMRTVEQRVYFQAGHEFNINSPKQLAHVLFEELGLTPGKKKKTGYSTDVNVLEDLAHVHELPAEVLQWRTLAKLRNTYTGVLPRLVNPRTLRVHTTFNQAVAATGRLSSSEPNLQNIPVRGPWGTRIRQCFTATEGHVLVSADYSQIELRILAHMSGDETLLNAFRDNEDIHSRTAAGLFGIDPSKVTTEMRRVGKTVNFGVIYGISAFGLSESLGVPRYEADRYIKLYFQRHPGIAAFIHRMIQDGEQMGYVSTMYGRKRPVPELRSKNRNTRLLGERLAINSPIQGTSADIIKLAMIEVDQRLRNNLMQGRMVLQVHDELILEVPENQALITMDALKDSMQGVAELSIPLKVDVGKGKNWADAH